MNDRCEWIAELYDDTLKVLMLVDEAVAHNDRFKAMAYIMAQKDKRIPAIERKAGEKISNELKEGLAKLNNMIKNGTNKEVIHKYIIDLDNKYALQGYIKFARCVYYEDDKTTNPINK